MTSSEYYIRGLDFLNNGKFEQAIEDFKAALKTEPDNRNTKNKLFWAYCERGNVYRRNKELDLAIQDYTEAIQILPDHVTAYSSRGMAHDMKGESEKAIADWEVVLKFKPDDETTKELIEIARKELAAR